jgi:hypothetical protein
MFKTPTDVMDALTRQNYEYFPLGVRQGLTKCRNRI